MTFVEDNGVVQYEASGKRRYLWVKPANRICEICKTTERIIVADHCHLHGWVRGWLCGPCNNSIAKYEYELYCPGCTFSADKWHSCSPARIAMQIDRRPILGVHLSRCPDCALVIDAVLRCQRDIVWRSFRNRAPLPVYARDMRGRKPRGLWFNSMVRGDYVKWPAMACPRMVIGEITV